MFILFVQLSKSAKADRPKAPSQQCCVAPLCLPVKLRLRVYGCSVPVVTTASDNIEELLDTSAILYGSMIRDRGKAPRTTISLSPIAAFSKRASRSHLPRIPRIWQRNRRYTIYSNRPFKQRINCPAGSGKLHRSIVDSRQVEDFCQNTTSEDKAPNPRYRERSTPRAAACSGYFSKNLIAQEDAVTSMEVSTVGMDKYCRTSLFHPVESVN